MRGQKGITLIALVITIIVLLILAIVTIGEVTDSSIIDHAQNAANTYEINQDAEEDEIKNAENLMDNIVSGL